MGGTASTARIALFKQTPLDRVRFQDADDAAGPCSACQLRSPRCASRGPRAGREAERPWIAEHVRTPAAQDFPPGATRKRPLIYV
jgi:hypothetical protein